MDYGATAGMLQGFMQGVQMSEQRKERQERLTQQKEMFEMQKTTQQTGQDIQAQQLAQAQMQTKQLQSDILKDKVFTSFDNSSLFDLNSLLTDNESLRQAFGGIQRLEDLPLTSDRTPKQSAESKGMKEPRIAQIVKNGVLETKIIDLSTYKMKSGYSNYKLQKDQAREEATLKLDKLRKEVGLVGKTKPLTPPQEKAAFELKGMKAEETITGYLNTQSKDFSKQLDIGDADAMISIGDKQVSINKVAKQAQGKNKLSTQDNTYMDGIHNAANAFIDLKEYLNTGEIDWNAMSKAKDSIASVIGTDWTSSTPEEKQKTLNRFKFDAQLKTAMAAYIKAMSGAAVSDEERQFYVGTITSGNWSNKEAALSNMDGFITGLGSSYKNKLDSIKGELPYTYLQKKSLYNTTSKKYQKGTETKTFDIKTATREEKIAELQRRGNK